MISQIDRMTFNSFFQNVTDTPRIHMSLEGAKREIITTLFSSELIVYLMMMINVLL